MDRPPLFTIDRHEKKLLGVCSGIGKQFGIDPTFVRIGVIAAAVLISFKWILLAYVAAGLLGGAAKRRGIGRRDTSEFDRMGETSRRGSMHDVRENLDTTDRKLMSIDQHLNTPQNDELARQIEALRRGEDIK
jgi:phage shock protein C